MNINASINRYSETLARFHTWRNELSLVNKIMLALVFAMITGLMAQVRFSLPFSPVPVTGQTFAVLLAGVVLGRWGGASMGMYVGLGAAGVPWFTSFQGGLSTLTGATGGFLIGFVGAALFVGYMTERYASSGKAHRLVPIMLFANFGLIYVPGLLVLNFWLGEFMGPVTLLQLIAIGAVPFIAGDVVKIAAAVGAAKLILPLKA